MILISTHKEMQTYSEGVLNQHKSIGFVPTMGALHEGHLKLVSQSVSQNDITVCSIFVNPIQFNNPSDLEKYPRNLERDTELLSQKKCDVVFCPSVEEIYPENEKIKEYSFGYLEQVMEGAFRPGHFRGVAVVVNKLFRIVKPTRAYFGEKDYQQLAIIHKLRQIEGYELEVIGCKTIRESDGLAMSSRNQRLNSSEREGAPAIYRALRWTAENCGIVKVEQIRKEVTQRINLVPGMKLEYFEICDAITLEPLAELKPGMSARACIAVWLGDVRLIDNISLNS